MRNPPMPEALGPVLRSGTLRIQQEAHLAESLVGVEQRNRYRVLDDSGQYFLEAAEQGTGVGAFFVRQFFGSRRQFEMDLSTPSGNVVMRLRRPFTWVLSSMDVYDSDGRLMGRIEHRWRWFSRRFDLVSPSGRVLAFLYGPFFKPWTFQLIHADQEVGRIEKEWSGFIKESMTNADNFRVTFSQTTQPELRILAFAAAFLLDFVYFERRGSRRSGLLSIDGD